MQSARNNSLWSRRRIETSFCGHLYRRESKGPSPPPPSSRAFLFEGYERGVAFRPENITPVKIAGGGERRAQRARNSLCARKCIKDESVIYRVQRTKQPRTSVMRERRGEKGGGGRVVGWITWWCEGWRASSIAEFTVAGFLRAAIQFAAKRNNKPD